jgi:glycosyltransferase involved in cell wall biosynthesis
LQPARLTEPSHADSGLSIAYFGANGMAPEYGWNGVMFQRPFGLAQRCQLHFFTRWESSISRDLVGLVALHRAPRMAPCLSPIAYLVFCLARLWKLRKQLDAVYTPAGATIFVGWLAQRLFRLKWIVEFCDHPYFDAICAWQSRRYVPWLMYYIRTSLSRPLVKMADLVVCAGHRDLIRCLGLPDGKVVVQPNGTDVRLCASPTVRKAAARLKVAYVGLVSRARGAGMMFEAMRRLKEIDSPVELVIMGPWNPKDSDWIAGEIAGLRGIVTITGPVSHTRVAAALREADVGLFPFPPMEEVEWIYPIKVYEYMAFGIPPICTGLAGVREIVQDGVNGLVLPSASSTDLAEVLAHLAANRHLVEKMRGPARKRAEDFDWPKIHQNLYRDMVRRLALPAEPAAAIHVSASL